MKKVPKIAKKVERSQYHIKLLLSDEEKSSIKESEMLLKEKYGIKKSDILRRLLLNHLNDGRILLLMGFTPKNPNR